MIAADNLGYNNRIMAEGYADKISLLYEEQRRYLKRCIEHHQKLLQSVCLTRIL
jgi:hypothetical protein